MGTDSTLFIVVFVLLMSRFRQRRRHDSRRERDQSDANKNDETGKKFSEGGDRINVAITNGYQSRDDHANQKILWSPPKLGGPMCRYQIRETAISRVRSSKAPP